VASAEEALIAMHSQRDFQLVITDVVLPHMSGPQLAAALASIKPGIKVLLISGYPEDVVLRGASAEAELHFLQKPFSSQALRRKVREMLGQNQTFGAAAGGAG
jgi:DNA-binding NtrC family response regulator